MLLDSHISQVVVFSPLQHLVNTQDETHLRQEWILQHIWPRQHGLVCGRSWKARRNLVGD